MTSFADFILAAVANAPMTTLGIADELDMPWTLIRDEINPLMKSGQLVVRGYLGESCRHHRDVVPLFGLPIPQAMAKAA